MEYRVRELLEKFLKAYMSERDLEKTLEFVSDEIISIGTGVQEITVRWNGFCSRNFLLIRPPFFIP